MKSLTLGTEELVTIRMALLQYTAAIAEMNAMFNDDDMRAKCTKETQECQRIIEKVTNTIRMEEN